jgi:hypothetical protein
MVHAAASRFALVLLLTLRSLVGRREVVKALGTSDPEQESRALTEDPPSAPPGVSTSSAWTWSLTP